MRHRVAHLASKIVPVGAVSVVNYSHEGVTFMEMVFQNGFVQCSSSALHAPGRDEHVLSVSVKGTDGAWHEIGVMSIVKESVEEGGRVSVSSVPRGLRGEVLNLGDVLSGWVRGLMGEFVDDSNLDDLFGEMAAE